MEQVLQMYKNTKFNICHHRPTSSTELQNSSFHVVERTRTSAKYQKNGKMHVQGVQNSFLLLHMQIRDVLVAVVVVVA